MELIAIFLAAVVGWQNGTLGRRELQGLALVVVGWSAVTSAARVPYVTLYGLAFDLLLHTAVVAVPYVLAVLARRIRDRRR